MFKEKFRSIILPYIIVSTTSILIFDIVYYFIFIEQKPLYSIRISNALIPLCYTLAVHLIFILPFTLKVHFNGKNNRFAANLFAFMMLSLSTMMSVSLVRDVTAEIKTVNSVTEIDPQSNGRYYKINSFDIDRTIVGNSFWITKDSGKNRPTYMVMNLSLAAPVKIKNTHVPHLIYWFCKDYDYNTKKKSIINSDRDNFKFETFKDFLSTQTINNVLYFECVPKKWIDSHDMLAVYNSFQKIEPDKIVILTPSYKPLKDKIFFSSLVLGIILLISILFWTMFMWKTTPKN